MLVVRADQLGDVTLSLPAMFALRDLFSDAKLTCLAAPANRELLLSTGLFSEVLRVEMIHDAAARRRFTTLAEQLRLRKALLPMSFDLAIDLSPGGDARPLLRLAGARYTAGFSPGDFPWLTFGINLQTRDVGNGREGSPHSVNPMALVVALAAVLRHAPFRLPSARTPIRACLGGSDWTPPALSRRFTAVRGRRVASGRSRTISRLPSGSFRSAGCRLRCWWTRAPSSTASRRPF